MTNVRCTSLAASGSSAAQVEPPSAWENYAEDRTEDEQEGADKEDGEEKEASGNKEATVEGKDKMVEENKCGGFCDGCVERVHEAWEEARVNLWAECGTLFGIKK